MDKCNVKESIKASDNESKMRILANFLIDKFIEEASERGLKVKCGKDNITIDEDDNHGTP